MALTKITTSVVAVNSLTAANIADNTIDATKIAQNQILARHIANATALTLDGGVTVDEITIDADTITATDDFIIDATTNIFLDADGGEVVLRDGGSNFGYFHQDSNNFEILSTRSDGDIIIKGNDGGSTITALTLDMSDAGTATFNHDVKLGDDSELVLGDGTDLKFYHSSSVNYIKTNSDLPLKIWDAGGAGILEMTPNGKVGIFHNGSEKIYTTSTGAVIAHNSDTDYSSTGEPAGILTLYNSNGSDGAGVNNYSSLEFNTGDGATSQGFINYVRTADNQGKFTFSQRTGSSSYAESMVIENNANATFAGSVTATKLVSTNGVLELDDNGSHNGIINVPASITINIDSDDGATTETFSIAKDKTAINDTDVLFRVQEDGKVGIGTTPLSHLTFESDHWNTGTEDGPSIRWNNGITTADSVLQNFEDSNVAPFVLGMNSYVASGGSFTTFNNSYAASYIYLGASGHITFGTSSSGTASQKMGILNDGLVCIGDTTGYPGGHDAVSRLQVTGGGSVVAIKQSQVNDASHRVVAVFTDSGGTYRGRITINNSACSFTSASDYRLKENIETLPNGLDRLKQLKPVKFKWKEHDYTSEGFIAHEVQEIYPDAIVGEKDGDVMQSMDYGKITPLLVKAIQEQQTIIDDLKARIETLEG